MEYGAHGYLISKGIRPSQQRIAVMDYLLTHRTHPTADEIFNALYPAMPTLSKTTVYNTLKLFTERGAVLCLDIDGKNARFDGDTRPHAHFMCKGCGCIYDLPLEEVEFVREEHIRNLTVTDVFLYMKGYCRECEEKMKSGNDS